MQDKLASLQKFFRADIWRRIDPPGYKGWLLRALRVLLIVIREIKHDQIFLKSSALTYLTILSIVPLMALIFGVSKGFGFEINVERVVADLFPAQEIVMTTTYEFAQNMLDNAKGGVIAGVSILILFITVMRLLNNIEEVFNSIWGKQRPRTWIRKFTDYLAILVVAPILIVTSSSISVFLSSQIKGVGERFHADAFGGTIEFVLAKFSVYLLIWILFTLIYIIIPNVKVSFKVGAIAGIVTGTIYQLIQIGFINFSVGVTKYNAIYGSLAALPLFFIFTQISWTVVCIGGEFAYALEKEKDYVPDAREADFSIHEKKRIALLVMSTIAKSFRKGEEVHSKQSLAKRLRIPHRYISDSVNILVESGLLIRSMPEFGSDHVYTPAVGVDNLDVNFVIQHFESVGDKKLFERQERQFKKIDTALSKMEAQYAKSEQNQLLINI